MGLTGIILTKNEEANIIDCIETILWCDEIVVVDDYSQDRTIEIVKSTGNPTIRIFQRKLHDDFASQRNYGLSKARGEWVLFVDSDERVTNQLKEEITHLILTNGRINKLNGFFIRRRDVMWGGTLSHGETGTVKLLRLARRGSGVWSRKVHEVWKVKGETRELKNPLIHFPHRSVKEFLHEINKYSTIRAGELFDARVKLSWLSIVVYPIGKFLLNFFVKLGFLDGTTGFVHAMIMTFHSFLVKSKLWLLWQKK